MQNTARKQSFKEQAQIKLNMPRKKGKRVVADLKRRSEKSLSLTKKILETERLEPLKLNSALKHYLKHWIDFTHMGFFSMACDAAGGNTDDNLLPQAAIGMMSAAFDIQDDIIDRSESKNKIPTVFGKYGVEMALLLGNAFLIEGLKLFSDSVTAFPAEKGKAIFESTRRLLFEVGTAHALETNSKQRRRTTPSKYMRITKMKAASIEADFMLGAVFGGGNESEVQSLARLGRILGILATLRDDLVDVFDIEELRQRIAVQDLPMPILFSMQNEEARSRIDNLLSKSRLTDNAVNELVNLTLTSDPVKHLKDTMQLLIGEGLSLLKELPRNTGSSLHDVVSFMLEDL